MYHMTEIINTYFFAILLFLVNLFLPSDICRAVKINWQELIKWQKNEYLLFMSYDTNNKS